MIKQQQTGSLLSATCSLVIRSSFPPCSSLPAPSVWGIEAPRVHAAFLGVICAGASLNINFSPPDRSLLLSKSLAPAAMVWSLLEVYEEVIPVKFGLLLHTQLLLLRHRWQWWFTAQNRGLRAVWQKNPTTSRCKHKSRTQHLMVRCLLAFIRKQNQSLSENRVCIIMSLQTSWSSWCFFIRNTVATGIVALNIICVSMQCNHSISS